MSGEARDAQTYRRGKELHRHAQLCSGGGTGSSRQLHGGGKYLPRELMLGEGGSGLGRSEDLALAHPSSPLDPGGGR